MCNSTFLFDFYQTHLKDWKRFLPKIFSMKKVALFSILSLFCLTLCHAQWATKSFTFEGVNRQYRVYLPSGYNQTTTYPLVMTLHGLGDDMNNFSAIGMNVIADTARFIVVVPQAIADPLIGATAWNSGAGMMGMYPNANINDVGFLNALIDTMKNNYAVHAGRIYVCGFSMGGYMTERLGCTSANRLAAIASMAGTIGNGLTSCNPARVLPVAHFHGTNDQTVPYTANNSGIDADSLIRLWVARNSCNPVPVHTTLPNTANDGYTVEHYVYKGTTPDAVVELFKVNGAGHTWLTQANDISYAAEAWRFFRRYQLPGTTAIGNKAEDIAISLSPNPVKDELTVSVPFRSARLRIFNAQGQTVFEAKTGSRETIHLERLPGGIYFAAITSDAKTWYRKFIVEK